MAFDKGGLDSYNDVASRMTEFFAKYPDGSLQPLNPAEPFKVQTIGDKTFIVYAAAAYRSADDTKPGIGTAWEPFPGRTPYTKDSEIQNAETSAWGRAIVAVGAADTRKGVASAEEVRNRQADRDDEWEQAARPAPTAEQATAFDLFAKRIAAAEAVQTLKTIWQEVITAVSSRTITEAHGNTLRDAVTERDAELKREAAGPA